MRFSPLLFAACFACLAFLASAQTFGSNNTKAYANITINNAIGVVNAVNESGYLLFYPDLSQAYADLNRSMSLYNASPSASVVLANRAAQEASDQYLKISAYKQESLVIMLILTAFFAYLMVLVVRPISAKKSKKSRR
jgi:hypothetical protein